MTIAIRATDFVPVTESANWRRHLAVLAGVAAVLLTVFRGDVGDLLHIWWTSTTFGHCLFIGPVIAWLVWQRREQLTELTPVAWRRGSLWSRSAGLAGYWAMRRASRSRGNSAS